MTYRLHFYEHTDSDGGQDFDGILRALDDIFERRHEIDVVNLSLGLECRASVKMEPSDILCLKHPANLFNQTREYHEHFKKMPEVLFVVAAGNQGEDARFTTPATLTTSSVPVLAHLANVLTPNILTGLTTVALTLTAPNVITVGAIDPQTNNRWIDDDRTASSYGPAITVAAAGANVYALNTRFANAAYSPDSGTSLAAPLVAGVVAFLRSIDPDIPAKEVVEILQETGSPTPVCTLNDPDISVEACPDKHREMWKLVDADAAVRLLLERRGISGAEATLTSDNTPESDTVSADAMSDRDVLVAFYHAMGGGHNTWQRTDNWLSDRPLGEWFGVTTDADGRVTRLDLRNNWMGGEIPSELVNLNKLEYLDLTSSNLRGKIPAWLGNLTNLKALLLDNNGRMSGEIPPELGNLVNLIWLNISYLGLTGEIPPELGNLTNLTLLDLQYNQLSGEVPPELGKISWLNELRLQYNQLSGCIPVRLAKVPNISHHGNKQPLELCE